MDEAVAVSALAALGQATRLAVFRLLIQNEPDGLAAGAIAARVGTPQNTMSNHLGVLANAGLVVASRSGQRILYRANFEKFDQLLELLSEARDQ